MRVLYHFWKLGMKQRLIGKIKKDNMNGVFDVINDFFIIFQTDHFFLSLDFMMRRSAGRALQIAKITGFNHNRIRITKKFVSESAFYKMKRFREIPLNDIKPNMPFKNIGEPEN